LNTVHTYHWALRSDDISSADLSVVRIEGDVDFAGSLEDARRLPQHLAVRRYHRTVPREIRELVHDPISPPPPTHTNTHTHTHARTHARTHTQIAVLD